MSKEHTPQDSTQVSPSYAWEWLWDKLIAGIFDEDRQPLLQTEMNFEEPDAQDELLPHERKGAKGYRPGWQNLRWEVWERDGGICQVCLDAISIDHYECGHIVDRCVGGQDSLDNLVVMCILCNRYKPVHDTKEEYETWRQSGGYKAVYEEAILSYYSMIAESEAFCYPNDFHWQ